MRLGIRQKLFLAVGVIAAMAVVSSLISFGFFGQVRGALSGVTERSIPAVSAALTLAAQSADLAAAAPTLAYAAGEGDAQTVEDLLKSGVSVKQRSPDGETALHVAGMRGDPSTVRALLAAGAVCFASWTASAWRR